MSDKNISVYNTSLYNVPCGPSYSTAPAISLTATENTASAQYRHSVSINKGKWEGYSINDAKKTLIYDFSIDKTKISLGDSVTLHWKIINGPGYSSRGGSFPPGEPRTRQEDPNAPPPGWDGGGGFLYPLKQFSLETVKNTIAQLFGISKKAEALENYPTEAECLAHGCDWVYGAYNPWDPNAPAGCICPLNTQIVVPSPSTPPLIALFIGNATCQKTPQESVNCPFQPNQIYPLVTSVSNIEPTNSFSVKNIFQKLFGLISPTQAQTVSVFEKTYEGTLTLYPQSPTNFYLITYGIIGEGPGYILSEPVQVDIAATVNPFVDLTGPSIVQKGADVTLTWTSNQVKSCTASASPANTYWTSTKPTNGSATIYNLQETTTFTITCEGLDGRSVQDSVQTTVTDNNNPWVDLTGPSTVQQGADVTLTWTSNQVKSNSCTASASPANSYWTGPKSINGTTTISSLQETTTFTITCEGLDGSSVQDSVQTTVTANNNPWVDLKVQKSPGHEFVDGPVWINSGDDVVLKWDSNNVNSCSATSTPLNSQWSGQVVLKNEGITISDITVSTTFTIICQGNNGKQAQDSVKVTIGNPPPPAIKWVKLDGPSIVQQGADVHLTWTSSGVKFCTASASPVNSYWTGIKSPNGSATIYKLQETTTFSINCDNGVATDSITVTVVPQVATINVKVLLDGKEWTGPVSYQLSGPTPITGNAPQSFNVQITNSQGDLYTLIYSSGGPKEAAFVGGQDTQSVVVKPGDNVTLTLPFSTQHLCQIYVKAFNQDTEWNGNLSYILIGPTVLTANNVPYTFSAVPPGVYYISYISGGPGANFVGVKEGNALTCPSDGSIDFSLLFGTAPSPTPILPPQEVGNNPPTAKIGCVADDPVKCVGTIDGDSNTPTITLYNASTDPDRDIRVCQWTVSGPQQLSKTDCSPVLIFDQEGTYTIQLIVIDSLNHENSTTIRAIVQSVKTLTPKFVWDPQVPVVQKETHFYDRSLTPTGTTLKNWSWTFEDGNPATSTEPNPVVIFNSTGQKNVTLQVKNSAGETKSINQLIDVRPAAPQWKEVIPK